MAMDKWTTARLLASEGIPVIPLHSVYRKKCTCSKGTECNSPGKHPRWHQQDLQNGVSDASTSARQVAIWWKRWPQANVGVATGSTSGLVVIDVDGPAGLDAIHAALTDEQLEASLQVATGSGGWHFYYRLNGQPLPNGVKVLPGVDVRGEGGYVVAPPSNHISGNEYEWYNEVAFDQLPRLPASFEQLILEKSPVEVPNKLNAEDWSTVLSEGNRNQELTRRAGKLLGNDIPPHVVLATMLEFNAAMCSPPLEPDEVRKIIESLAKRDAYRRQQQDLAKEEEKSPLKKVKPFGLLTLHQAFTKYGGFEAEWLIPGWLPKATNGLVVAPPGSYKTWILADLCTAVSGARPFLGQYEVEQPGPVFIVQQEDFLPGLMSRIARMLGAPEPKFDGDDIEVESYSTDWPIYIHDERQLHFGKREAVLGLIQAVEEMRPSLVVLDPLYSAVDMKDYMSDAAQQMMVLKDLRDRYGCSFLLAHHTTKGSREGRARDDLWGSQFLNAWLETGWQMRLGDAEGVVQVTRHFKVMPNPAVVDLTFAITEWDYNVTIQEVVEEAAPAAPTEPNVAATHADLLDKLGSFEDGGNTIPLQKLGITVKNNKCYAN